MGLNPAGGVTYEKERWDYVRKKLVSAGVLKKSEETYPEALMVAMQCAADAAEREAHRTHAEKADERARTFLLSQMDDVTAPNAERREAARLLLGGR